MYVYLLGILSGISYGKFEITDVLGVIMTYIIYTYHMRYLPHAYVTVYVNI